MTDNNKTVATLTGLMVFVIGTSIFSMHFGASCMLWPTTWGRNSGVDFLGAFAGFFFSGLVLPLMAYFAVANSGGPLFTVMSRVSEKFAYTFGTLTVMLLGPLFVIPRMSAASWDAISRVTSWDKSANAWGMSVVFAVFYYAIVYWFIYKETKIVDKLAKILVPTLIGVEVVLIGTTILFPIGEPVARNYAQSPFAYGFINGYQTMDLPCALMFAGIIIIDLKNRLRTGLSSAIRPYLLSTGIVGFLLLGSIMGGEFWRGHTASGVFPDSSYAKLSADIIMHQLGNVGATFFNVALIFAAMTTAIGLTAGTAEFVVTASKKRYTYQQGALACLVLTVIVSVTGLDAIIKWTGPTLNFVYPVLIAVVFFTAMLPRRYAAMRGAAYFCTGWGLVEAVHGYMLLFGYPEGLNVLMRLVPLGMDGMGFFLFLALGAVYGHFMLQKGVAPALVTEF